MSNKKSFEDLLKESLNNYQAPYDASQWDRLSKKMDEMNLSNNTGNFGAAKIVVGVLLIVALGVSTYLFTIPQSTELNETVVAENANTATNVEVKSTTVEEAVIFQSNQQIMVEPEETKEPTIVKADLTPNNSNQQLEISLSKTALCLNEKLHFETPFACDACTYTWEFGDGTVSQLKNPVHVYKTSGTYSVNLVVKHPKKGKIKERKWKDAITVYNKPSVDFIWKSAEKDCHNAGICFVNLNDNDAKYRWEFGDKTMSTEPHPTHTFTRKGHYNVKLVSENEHGCKDSILKPIHVLKAYNLLAPTHLNVSTRDTWMPIALINNNYDFELSVINPNGKAVFITSDRNINWDGTDTNGVKAKSGDIYLWLARIKNTDGSKTEYGGSIEITE
jgi:PKD repeat protein